MAYIGKQPVVGNFVKLDAIVTSATATYNLLNGGVAYFPQTANNCIVSLNGVIQSPTSAYTISGSTIVFSDTLTSSDTIDFILVLGDVLAIGTPSDGTVTSAKLASGTTGLISWQSVQTTGFTAVAGRGYPCNTTSAAFTVTLPASPSVGDTIILLDYAGTFDTNNLTVNPNSNKLEGGTLNLILSGDREGVTLTYIDSTQGWLASSGVNEGTDALSSVPYSVDFLVVAGGGGTAGNSGTASAGGGGGAGGFRTSTQSVAIGTVITVTVGDGGAAGSSGSNLGSSGSDSSISGSGLTTITSAGGGRGGGYNGSIFLAGANGGSGGGGNYNALAGGSGNTPSTSPSQGNNGGTGTSSDGAAGGGGAGAVGSNHNATNNGTAGGNGTASSITGSSVTYAGGGGGGSYTATVGTGGSGGGGTGTNGTANTGGGGGGKSANGSSANAGTAGGKGVVILSVPDANYSGTTTGSPTVTPNANGTGKTVLQFNGTGSYTA